MQAQHQAFIFDCIRRNRGRCGFVGTWALWAAWANLLAFHLIFSKQQNMLWANSKYAVGKSKVISKQ